MWQNKIIYSPKLNMTLNTVKRPISYVCSMLLILKCSFEDVFILHVNERFYRERRREIEKVFHPLVHYSIGHNGQIWDNTKPGAKNFWVSPAYMQDPKNLDNPLLLSQAISRELDQKWSSRTHMWRNQCPYGLPVLQDRSAWFTQPQKCPQLLITDAYLAL